MEPPPSEEVNGSMEGSGAAFVHSQADNTIASSVNSPAEPHPTAPPDLAETIPPSLETFHGDVTAYDFLEDGRTIFHSQYVKDLPGSGVGGAFDCDLPPRTVRLVLRETRKGLHEIYDNTKMSKSPEREHPETCAHCRARTVQTQNSEVLPEACSSNGHDRTARESRSRSQSQSTSPSNPGWGSRPRSKSRSIHRRPSRSRSPSPGSHRQRPQSRSRFRTPRRHGSRARPKLRSSSRNLNDGESSSTPYRRRSGDRSRSRPLSFIRSEPNMPRKDSWKLYRGASGIESRNLLELWDQNRKSSMLSVGTNSIFQFENDNAYNLGLFAGSSKLTESHNLILNGRLIRFTIIPNVLRSTWYHEDTLEMELTMTKHHFKNELGNVLREQLFSYDSAMRLYTGSTDIGARLLVLDILVALMNSWQRFLKQVRREGAWQPRSVGSLGDIENKVALLADREYLKDFAKATKDLIHATKVTIETIEMLSVADDQWNRKFKYLALKVRLGQEQLSTDMSAIESDANDVVANVERLVNERQEASIRRLTLVASIFLPLTTAASLLSMNNRVKSLGPLWWDWLGIVLIVALIVILGYRFTAGWHEINKNAKLRWIRQLVQIQYGDAKVKVFGRKDSKKTGLQRAVNMFVSLARATKMFSATAVISVLGRERKKRRKPTSKSNKTPKDTQNDRDRKLIPLWPRILSKICPYLFWLGAIASFLLGMFVDIRIGALGLGYSVAGTTALFLVSIVLWRLNQAFWWIVHRDHERNADHERRDNANQREDADVETGRSRASENSPESPQQEREKGKTMLKGVIRISVMVISGFVLCWASFIYVATAFLVGFTLIDVLVTTLTNGLFVLIAVLSERDQDFNSQTNGPGRRQNSSRSNTPSTGTRNSTLQRKRTKHNKGEDEVRHTARKEKANENDKIEDTKVSPGVPPVNSTADG